MPSRWPACAALTLTLLVVVAGTTHAQKADVVRLANGDHITGEVKTLSRGQLELSTDDVGTLYFEWDKIVSLSAVGQFEVTTTDGRRFLGSLAAGDPKTLVIVEVANRVSLSMIDVATIADRSQFLEEAGRVDRHRLQLHQVEPGFSAQRQHQLRV